MNHTLQPLPAAAGLEARAAAWLADRADYLDPALAADDTALFSRKALVEVALLVGLRARLGPPLDATYTRLLDVLVDVAARPSYRELVLRDRRALLLYAGTYAALRLCGREDEDLRQVLVATVKGRYAAGFERVPYRHLDLLHTLELAGIDCPAPGVDHVLPLTLLVSDPNVWELTVSDTYAITHAVFYVTDFGQRAVDWPPGVTTGSISDLLLGCLALARAREDADLVGELLMCLTCVRADITDGEAAARTWLRSWQEDDGRLEGPPGVIPSRLTEADEAWGSWATAYHTTIVGALEDLLFRAIPRQSAVEIGPSPHDVPSAALASAADWLATHGAADLRTLAWTSRSWVAAGNRGGARSLLTSVGLRPGYADLLPYATRDIVVMVAGLADQLDVRDEVLTTVREMAKESPAPEPPPGLRPLADDLPDRDRGRMLVADLISRGPSAGLSPQDAECAGHQLIAGARRAVEDYDLAWFAVAVRGLVRLPHLAPRLVRDAVTFLLTQQTGSGAIGAPLTEDPDERGSLHREWTLLATAALVESAGI